MTLGAAEDAVQHATSRLALRAKMSPLSLAGFRAVRIDQRSGGGAANAADLTRPPSTLRETRCGGEQRRIRDGRRRSTPGSARRRRSPRASQGAVRRRDGRRDAHAAGPGHVIVGNEPNFNRFWLPQFDDAGATAPRLPRAARRDLRRAEGGRPSVTSAAARSRRAAATARCLGRATPLADHVHPDLGAAYRRAAHAALWTRSRSTRTARTRAVADVGHPLTTTVGLADYDKLVGLLGEAFDGTAQPGSSCRSCTTSTASRPSCRDARPRSTPAPSRRRRSRSTSDAGALLRRRRSTSRSASRAWTASSASTPSTSARTAWQSGVYYADGSPKTSLRRSRRAGCAAALVASCPGLALDVIGQPLTFGLERAGDFRACAALLDRLRLPGAARAARGLDHELDGRPRSPAGVLTPGGAADLRVAAGRYRIAVTIKPRSNGAPVMRESAAFVFDEGARCGVHRRPAARRLRPLRRRPGGARRRRPHPPEAPLVVGLNGRPARARTAATRSWRSSRRPASAPCGSRALWDPGETAPQPDELEALCAGCPQPPASATCGSTSRSTTRAPSRAPLAPARAASSPRTRRPSRDVPEIRDVIVGNEPNLNRFWIPQFGPDGENVAAPAYLELLATVYDALKEVSADVQVYGGALAPRGIDRPNTGRDTHSPTQFIRDLGEAYRASGRDRPVMDAFAFHPYAESSKTPPDRPHPNTTPIGLADYDKLVSLLGEAFDGTAQPGSQCRSCTTSSASRRRSRRRRHRCTSTRSRRRPASPTRRRRRATTSGRSSSPASRTSPAC